MADQKTNKIGWNLPEDCVDPQQCHPPIAPEGIPNLPFIPNQTGIVRPNCNTEHDGPAYTYGCCAPAPVHQQELPRQDHLLGRPINAFLNPSNQKRSNLQSNEFWIEGSNGSIPAGAVEGGKDIDGQPLYVARAECEGSLTPGKLNSSGCHIPWGSSERRVEKYEVLCGLKGNWMQTDRDKIPEKALKSGYSETGEILYVGRAKHQGHMIPGKVHPSHKVCYVSFGGKELSYVAYEIFVVEE